MDAYEQIEEMLAKEYGQTTTTRKAVGDFMLTPTHAVNVKSNNVAKQNYSPNMISIQKMHKWIYEEGKDLSFIFVDYTNDASGLTIKSKSRPIPLQHISWECLSIEAQGYGVIQKVGALKVVEGQTKGQFYKGFIVGYNKFMQKEKKKHEKFSGRFIKDHDSIDLIKEKIAEDAA